MSASSSNQIRWKNIGCRWPDSFDSVQIWTCGWSQNMHQLCLIVSCIFTNVQMILPCANSESFPFLYCVTLCNVCFRHFLPLQNVRLCFGTLTCSTNTIKMYITNVFTTLSLDKPAYWGRFTMPIWPIQSITIWFADFCYTVSNQSLDCHYEWPYVY